MPRRYQRRYKRKYYKRKPAVKSGWDTALGYAKTALKVANFVRSVVNVEYKYSDLIVLPTTVDYNGIQGLFHDIPQGTSAFTRNGDLIKLKSLEIKLLMRSSVSATDQSTIRFLLVQGMKENGQVPTLDDIITNVGISSVVNSLREINPEQNYKVLLDRTYTVVRGTEREAIQRTIFLKPWHHIKYETGTNTAATGGLYYFFVSDVVNTSGSKPVVSLQSRVRFIDN